jgi:hypothetical protein
MDAPAMCSMLDERDDQVVIKQRPGIASVVLVLCWGSSSSPWPGGKGERDHNHPELRSSPRLARRGRPSPSADTVWTGVHRRSGWPVAGLTPTLEMGAPGRLVGILLTAV